MTITKLPHATRETILVAGVAAIGAVLTERLLKPKMKKGLKVR